MAFDATRFERAEFIARTRVVEVLALTDFFDENETPEWVVRGLTSNELHRAMEAGKRQISVEAIVKAIAQAGEQADAEIGRAHV